MPLVRDGGGFTLYAFKNCNFLCYFEWVMLLELLVHLLECVRIKKGLVPVPIRKKGCLFLFFWISNISIRVFYLLLYPL